MKRIALVLALSLSLFSFISSGNAQTGSGYQGIIPAPDAEDNFTCNTAIPRQIPNEKWTPGSKTEEEYLYQFYNLRGKAGEPLSDKSPERLATEEKDRRLKTMSLGTKIQGGCVQLSDVPAIIIHLIDLLTKIAGSVAVAFILYAGFQLIMSGITEDREAAKNTIKWAILGLVLCLLSWVIVNVLQVQLTA
ncbi:pilin [Candidatus Gracilibacteria bacterium]|nr:pilin [Candidatus Gracilibacteria bacterium]